MSGEWQPIETAPRDDESVLLFKPNTARAGASTFVGYWTDDPLYVWAGWVPVGGVYVIHGVTHWRPLPDPPKGSR